MYGVLLRENWHRLAGSILQKLKNGLIEIIVQISPKGSSLDMQICLQFDTSKGLEKIASPYLPTEAVNTFTAIVDLSRFNNSCLKSPASTLVDLTFQSRARRYLSLNQLRILSL